MFFFYFSFYFFFIILSILFSMDAYVFHSSFLNITNQQINKSNQQTNKLYTINHNLIVVLIFIHLLVSLAGSYTPPKKNHINTIFINIYKHFKVIKKKTT